MTDKRIRVVDANLLIMGLTFRENCPDLRNARIVDLVDKFKSFKCNVEVFDPWVSQDGARLKYGIIPVDPPQENHYDAIALAAAHTEFSQMGAEAIRALGKDKHVLFDIKFI